MEEEAGEQVEEAGETLSLSAIREWTLSNVAIVSGLAFFVFALFRVLQSANFVPSTVLTIWNSVGPAQVLTASLVESPSVMFIFGAAWLSYFVIIWAIRDTLNPGRLALMVGLAIVSLIFLWLPLALTVCFLLAIATLEAFWVWFAHRKWEATKELDWRIEAVSAGLEVRLIAIRSNELEILGQKLDLASTWEKIAEFRRLAKQKGYDNDTEFLQRPSGEYVSVNTLTQKTAETQARVEAVSAANAELRSEIEADRAETLAIGQERKEALKETYTAFQRIRVSRLAYAGFIFVVLVLLTLIQSPWWAVEKVTNTKNETVVGYVIAADSDWTTTMVESDRTIRYIPTKEVASRQNCRLDSNAASEPPPRPWLRLQFRPIAEPEIPKCYP